MNFLETVMEKWNTLMAKVKPVLENTKTVCLKVADVIKKVCRFLFRMRKIVLAVPVVWGAVVLAIRNEANLPAVVGLNLQTNGEFAIQIARELAVFGPLVVTAFCLLLMFCSRRLLTPWLVSMFTLLLPIFIMVVNTFPA